MAVAEDFNRYRDNLYSRTVVNPDLQYIFLFEIK